MGNEAVTGRKVRIGIIGCGQIAQAHLRNYAEIPDAEVVACADIDPEAADSTAKRFGIPNVYYSGWEMLKRDDLDAVDVCLHNNLHLPGARAVLESGRHCYCEKPMAGAYRDAITMRQVARDTGKMLHIQLAGIYSAEVRAAEELIRGGALGEVFFARSTGHRRRGRPYVDGYGKMQFVQKEVSGGGALYDMGVYHISELLYLLGNPTVERVSGKTYQKTAIDPKRRELSGYSVEELGMGFVRFAGDLSMDIIESWAIHLDSFEGSYVVGSEGGVRLRPFGYFRSEGDLDLSSTASMDSAKYRWRKLRTEDGDTDMRASSQGHWVAALQGKTELLPTADIALNTMLISEGIYLSQKLNREVTAEEVREMSVSTALEL
jgi:Predicted dehydrogenases and related proteins